MTTVRLPAILLSSALLASACNGANASPPATPTPSTSAPASGPTTGVPEGGECGDDVAIQKKCAQGLVCAPKPGAPVSEHTPGVCTKK